MAIMVGTGRGALAGVLIKNAEALEIMEKVDTLVVDKTGTLTEGRPRVTSVVAANGFDETQVLRVSATLERASEHPLAAAILTAAKERGIAPGNVTDFPHSPAKGSLEWRKRKPPGSEIELCCSNSEFRRAISTNAPNRRSPMAKR